jgi:hypothetical protein
MEQSPSRDVDSHPESREIPSLLWNPKVQYRFHKGPSVVPNPEPDESSPHHLTLFP